MQIHVVRQNESLTSIAELYRTTAQAITVSNQLPNPNDLVVGQALVIPIVGSFYWVQPGDSLYNIGLQNQISYLKIAEINGINPNQILNVGTRLYLPPRPKTTAEFNGYIEPRGSQVSATLEQSARETGPFLTYLAPFSYEASRTGDLKPPLLNNFPAIAKQNREILIMVITNKENDQFNADVAHILLTDPKIQDHFLNQIVETATKNGFRDIHFDFEYLRPADKEAYNTFLRKAKNIFKPKGWLISTALAPKTSTEQVGQWYEAHDYRAHGEIVDFVVIMTYEWGYSGGPPMAVSPIDQVRRVIKYAVSQIPSNKIMMGQNLYGYDWTLPYTPGTIAKALSPQNAIGIAAQKNVKINYDLKAQAPNFQYQGSDGKQHIVWFEDARSIQAKFNLIKEFRLRGMSYWKLGLSFPQNWLLISENFHVEKKISS
ncbi:MAG: spore gernimation protein [Bacillales bacterium]|jgi:spore germination protein|nr:spore gernimation protein [Bacillales bacterium]